MQNILITGGSSYLGSKIIDYFNDSKIGIDLKENDLAFLEGNLENEWKKIEGLIQEKNPANIGM